MYISRRHKVRSEIRILKYVTKVGQRCRQWSPTGASSVADGAMEFPTCAFDRRLDLFALGDLE